MPLAMLKTGETACIEKIVGGRVAKGKLNNLGLVTGKSVKIYRDNGGPLIIGIGDNRIALGRGMAHKVMVVQKGCEN